MERSVKYSDELSAKLQYETATSNGNIDCDKLYDDAWRSEAEDSDAASLEEVAIDYLDIERDDCDHTVNNAITEVSNEFLSGKIGPSRQVKYGNSDESHSDTEFKLVRGLAYVARYPESAAGMSDNDWNPYGTESDTNVTPRVHSQSGLGAKMSGSRKSSLVSFNPKLHSTDLNVNTPSAAIQSIPDYVSTNDKSESKTFFLLQPDISADFASDSGSSRQSKYDKSDKSTSEKGFKLVRGLAYVARYPESVTGMSDNDSNTNGTESDTYVSPQVLSQNSLGQKMPGSRKSSPMSFNPKLHSTDLNVNTPSAAIQSIPDYASNAESTNRKSESKTFFLLQPDISADFASVSETRRMVDVARPLSESSVNHVDLNKTFRESNPATFRGSNSAKSSVYTKRSSHRSTVDYSLLQKELQNIQDNLHVLNPEMKLDLSELDNTANRPSGEQTCMSSGSDCDIIPSTTITPDRQSNQMAWDYAADLGYQQRSGLMGDISLETYMTNSHRPSGEKIFNSDGDETRTSDGSDRGIDHAAADQALTEISQIRRPHTANHHDSYNNVDQVLCNFENQRQQIESCYQQLNNPGLAEKVSRILASQDPQSQASGILSEVTAQERQMRSQLIVNPQRKDFNFSVAMSDFNESSESLAKPDNVRKRLDLSGLSSTEVSRLKDSSAVYVPGSRGFAAFDDVARLLSSQMVKVSERTFNNSIEVVPQRIVQCYPLTLDNKIQRRSRDEKPDDEVEKATVYPSESMPNWSSEADLSEQTSSPNEVYTAQNEQTLTQSHDDSDSSSSRRREKYRPYRPAGSKEVYYTESDVASVADSATTMESTHFGSDDARAPVLPPSVLGSRQDAPNAAGIYGSRKPTTLKQHGDILPPIQEKPVMQDDSESQASQLRKDNITVESVHSQEESPEESSSFAKQELTSGPKKNDNSSRHENVITTNSGHSRSVVEGEQSSQHSESGPVTVGGTFNGRRADRRNQQEHDVYELQKRNKSRNQIQNSENNNNLSQMSVHDDFPSVSRQYKRPNDYDRRHADVSLHSHHSSTLRQSDRTTQPLSLRSHVSYDDDRVQIDIGQKYANSKVGGNRGRHLYSATDTSEQSPSRFRSESDDRYFARRYNEAEKMFSPQERGYQEEIHKTLHRSHSDEDMYGSGRDRHLSRYSHHPLSSDSRKTTDPVSGHRAERSVRLSPSDWSNHQQTNMPRTQSPPPTFLARERGQVPRSYTASLRQPENPTRRYEDYSSTPRTMPSLQNMEHLRQPVRFVDPADRQVLASPESDSAEYDHQPVSQRTQLLTQALSQEKEQGVQPNIDVLWEQFKASNESSETSLNTSSLEAVTDLILHPSPHLVTQCLKEREEHLINRQERAEAEREQRRAERLENRHVHQSSSEDEVNLGYATMLTKKEQERMKRRAAKKKKGELANTVGAGADNCLDNLFSIAEDASFEQTPNKCNSALSAQSANVLRRPHVIDPNMKKLRERISKQRQIIDKSTLKELQKIDKLKKLEHLLSAKKRNEISDETLKRQLEEISSASTHGSDESLEGMGKLVESHNTTPLSDDSTTAKDSSAEMHTSKMQKEMRIKMMQAKETEQNNKYSSIRGNKNKGSLSARHGAQEQLDSVSSESQLLKLVAEGILTAEEAYRISVERESAMEGKSSHAAHHKHSLDDIYDRQNGRLHKFISPYVRSDSHHSYKNHYIPKLKHPQSIYDVAASYPESWNEHDSQQNSTDISEVSDLCPSGPYFTNEFAPTKTSHRAQSGTGSRTHSSPSITKFTWPESIKYRGNSPPRSAALLNFLPARHQNRTSPQRQQSPTRYERRISPSRSLPSPRNKENNAKVRVTNKKSAHRGSARHEKAHKSEKKPVLRQKSPMSGGIAWHIPLDVPQNKSKLSDARRGMPLQERKMVTNTLSKKTREQLQMDDLELLEGWQREQMDHKHWQKPGHPQGISNELWEHDALATKTNHRDVDPLMDRVEFILSKHSMSSSTEGENRTLNGKPTKLSLQEALLTRKQSFISKCKERQKRLALAREHRKMQECLRLEREALFMDLQQMAAANINAHPYSDNLYQPKRRCFSKQEMKEITMKHYKKLPEVLQKQESVKKIEQCQLNRLRADIFNRKIQREVLRKKSLRRR